MVTYLARRERRGRQTAYDEVLERDVEAIARAIVFLQRGRSNDLPTRR